MSQPGQIDYYDWGSGLGIGIEDWELGIGIWNLVLEIENLGLELGFVIDEQDRGLGLKLMCRLKKKIELEVYLIGCEILNKQENFADLILQYFETTLT